MSNYPDDIYGSALCEIEGCMGNGNCPRCGKVNYHLLGFYGAVGRWARAWHVSKAEAERRIVTGQEERAMAALNDREAT